MGFGLSLVAFESGLFWALLSVLFLGGGSVRGCFGGACRICMTILH